MSNHADDATPPPVVFLGFYDRAAYVRQGNTNVSQWNVLGLKNIVLSNIYPLSIAGRGIGLALFQPIIGRNIIIRFRHSSGPEAGWVSVGLTPSSDKEETALLRSEGQLVMASPKGWFVGFVPVASPAPVFNEPGEYEVILDLDGHETILGSVLFALVDPEPLTPERVAAIRANPSARKVVRLTIGCGKCKGEAKAYAGLEKAAALEDSGFTWHSDLPDSFTCSCGSLVVDLRIIKRNLPGVLGGSMAGLDVLSFTPLYELGALEDLATKFAELLRTAPREEIVQQFFEENPLLLHQFPANEIYFKPPLLTAHRADIGLVTPQRELVLIELERVPTKLLTKKGGIASPLQHALDQVRDWLHVADDHRIAALDSIGIQRDRVGSVKGVVIAGRDAGYDVESLRRLKGNDFGRVSVLTYDDILGGLNAIIKQLRSV